MSKAEKKLLYTSFLLEKNYGMKLDLDISFNEAVDIYNDIYEEYHTLNESERWITKRHAILFLLKEAYEALLTEIAPKRPKFRKKQQGNTHG